VAVCIKYASPIFDWDTLGYSDTTKYLFPNGEDRVATRLSRSEKKAETRQRLLDAAASVFARRGFHAASVADIAQEAGFTKGAVYSNFATKEDLFLALADQRFETRVAALYEAVRGETTVEAQAQAAGRRFVDFLENEPEWSLLFIEFWAYAVRDPQLRAKFAASSERIHAAVARLIDQQVGELGVPLPVDSEEVAVAAIAMGNGIALDKLAAPDSVPDELYGRMLAALFQGLMERAGH
jgi:AcrR family transcriptional regulator